MWVDPARLGNGRRRRVKCVRRRERGRHRCRCRCQRSRRRRAGCASEGEAVGGSWKLAAPIELGERHTRRSRQTCAERDSADSCHAYRAAYAAPGCPPTLRGNAPRRAGYTAPCGSRAVRDRSGRRAFGKDERGPQLRRRQRGHARLCNEQAAPRGMAFGLRRDATRRDAVCAGARVCACRLKWDPLTTRAHLRRRRLRAAKRCPERRWLVTTRRRARLGTHHTTPARRVPRPRFGSVPCHVQHTPAWHAVSPPAW